MKRLRTPDEIGAFVARYDCFICDCDGVLWSGSKALPGSREALVMLAGLNKKLYYQSNNSTSSRAAYVKKFQARLQVDVKPTQVYGSSYLTALYFSGLDFKKKVYVVGSSGIKDELDAVGINSFGFDLHDDKSFSMDTFVEEFRPDPDIGAVVVGYCPVFNNYKLAYAMCCARKPGCLFIATNCDETFPVSVLATGERLVLPGTGTFVAAVKTGVGREPKVMGKPETFGIECILDACGVRKEKCCFVGDRLNTDILMANRAGIDSLLTLTGVTAEADLQDVPDGMMPTYVVDNFGDLIVARKASEPE